MPSRTRSALASLAAALALGAAPALAQAPSGLEQVAAFEHQATGVAVSEGGRVFVNFPRWTEDSPTSVAEVMKDGSIKAYPDDEWNSWRNARKDEVDPKTHFVCVQSVVAEGGNLWVLDPGAPASEKIVRGAPKLVRIDLASNKAVQTIPFDERVAPQGSYLNDIRFSPDGKWGYLTDSGRGALLVVELASGKVRRMLDGVTSTQPEPGVVPVIDGKKLLRPDGRAPAFASDGITLSKDGATLYWQALTGKTLYSIPTAALRDAKLSSKQLEKQIRTEGAVVIADGYWTTRKGQFLITSPEDNSVKLRGADGKLATVVQDARLRWPDSMAEGPEGAIYVTASHIQDSPWFKPEVGIAVKTELWRFKPPS